jgi:hypothetical protein
VRIRITSKPREVEVDGVNLGVFQVGTVREVSASIASWLIAEGYAKPEMRAYATDHPSNNPLDIFIVERRQNDR